MKTLSAIFLIMSIFTLGGTLMSARTEGNFIALAIMVGLSIIFWILSKKNKKSN